MKRGFTLIELVVVLIIVAILGTLGLTQYTRMIEKARGAEAKNILGTIRQLAAAYYMEWGSAASLTPAMVGIGGTGGVPSDCLQISHYFSYIISPAANSVTITATRCTAGGKLPVGPAGTLILTSTLDTGADAWSGTGGY